MLLEALIAQVCGSLAKVDYQACAKAVEASAVQTRVAADATLLEKKATEAAHRSIASYTGETPVAAAGLIYKVTRDRALSYPLVKVSDGIVPAVTPTLGVGRGDLNLKWNF